MKHILILGILTILLGCDKNGTGMVSFGSNDDLLNCIHEAKVYIDDAEIGRIPGYCDSIIDCDSDYTLNYQLSVGDYRYKIVIENESGGTCYMETSGEFTIGQDECVRIYYDVIQNNN